MGPRRILDVDRGVEDLGGEVGHVAGGDPCGAEASFDLAGLQVTGLDGDELRPDWGASSSHCSFGGAY